MNQDLLDNLKLLVGGMCQFTLEGVPLVGLIDAMEFVNGGDSHFLTAELSDVRTSAEGKWHQHAEHSMKFPCTRSLFTCTHYQMAVAFDEPHSKYGKAIFFIKARRN